MEGGDPWPRSRVVDAQAVNRRIRRDSTRRQQYGWQIAPEGDAVWICLHGVLGLTNYCLHYHPYNCYCYVRDVVVTEKEASAQK